MIKKISQCRICKNTQLTPILDLGTQMLTGVFPTEKNTQTVTSGPLRLVKCCGEKACGLVQLEHCRIKLLFIRLSIGMLMSRLSRNKLKYAW